MRQSISSIADIREQIEAGRTLLLAGDEDALRQLPKGNWIGGTIPYLISSDRGGMASRELLCATDITDLAVSFEIAAYDQESLARIYAEAPQNGFSFLLLPGLTKAHYAYALHAPTYKDFGMRPLLGWIAGVRLTELGTRKPLVFHGQTGEGLLEGALVLRAVLAPDKAAEIGIINLFEQGDGDIITFDGNGFVVSDAVVNGTRRNYVDYLLKREIDTRFPLVADYYGVPVNISFQEIDAAGKCVKFAAPVFAGIRYRHAKPINDYAAAFKERIGQASEAAYDRVVFSCNCLLNYQYGELNGKTTEPFIGPVTFGEIAYQLLNQSLVYLEIVQTRVNSH